MNLSKSFYKNILRVCRLVLSHLGSIIALMSLHIEVDVSTRIAL